MLTTLHPEQIVQLSRENGRIVAGRAPEPTYGAEAGDVLNVVMGVDERPPNEFTRTLKRYMRLIGDDQGESREAKKLRRELERLSPHESCACHRGLGDPASQAVRQDGNLQVKRIRTLRDRPRGLSEYLELEADDPDWDRFRKP